MSLKTHPHRTNEDAFGTPAAARSSMMKVAGKTDDDLPPGEELLVDDPDATELSDMTDEGDDTVMKGPLYPHGSPNVQKTESVVRVRLGELRAYIARCVTGHVV